MRTICSVSECRRPVYAKKICSMHYQRVLRHGSTDMGRAPNGAGWISVHGYRYMTINGKAYVEHRLVMERILGRKLTDDEEVHHLNHDRLDNRPANLQVVLARDHTLLHNREKWPTNTRTHRRCPDCERILPRTEFHRNRALAGGRSPYCRSCEALRKGRRRGHRRPAVS